MAAPKLDPSRLTPQHLAEEPEPSMADHLAAVEKAVAPPAPTAPPKERSHTFPFRYVGGNGRVWEGTFCNRVPDMATRQKIGVLRARLNGGMSLDSLDAFTAELSMMVSHMSLTLVQEGRPEWAADLLKVEDPEVLYRLWEEVAAHEATFLGRK